MERETGVEPATSSLARKHSTTELLPLVFPSIAVRLYRVNGGWFDETRRDESENLVARSREIHTGSEARFAHCIHREE